MPVQRILGLVGIVIVLIICAYLLSDIRTTMVPLTSANRNNEKVTTPPFTPAVRAQLAASKGFQALISYTDRGFEPESATIKTGDTVRFTNNSSQDLWVASTGTSAAAVYPEGSSNECGQSAFDSCHVIGRGEFWEFTFDDAGTWGFQNNRDTKMKGIINVK